MIQTDVMAGLGGPSIRPVLNNGWISPEAAQMMGRCVGSVRSETPTYFRVARSIWSVSTYCWKEETLPSTIFQTCANWALMGFPVAL